MDYAWNRDMSVKEFMVDFYSRLDKICKLDMTDELKVHQLLDQGSLENCDGSLVFGAADGGYSLQALATSLIAPFCSKAFPETSMNTNRPCQALCRATKRTTFKIRESRYDKAAPDSRLSSKFPLFYIFRSSNQAGKTLAAIIDSRA